VLTLTLFLIGADLGKASSQRWLVPFIARPATLGLHQRRFTSDHYSLRLGVFL
jgi:hypothetical protein